MLRGCPTYRFFSSTLLPEIDHNKEQNHHISLGHKTKELIHFTPELTMKSLFYSMKIFSTENTTLNKAFTIKKSTCAQRVKITEKLKISSGRPHVQNLRMI